MIRLACLICDREDCDGIKCVPKDWHDVERVQTLRQARKTYDDPSKAPPGFSVFDWWTHLGVCPDCV